MTGRARDRTVRPMSLAAPPADVLDHRFGAGEPLTVGVEEEYMLLDAETLDLVQRVESLMRAEQRGDFAELVSPELFESLVEFHTPVCARLRRRARAGRVRTHAIATAGHRACDWAVRAPMPSASSSASR